MRYRLALLALGMSASFSCAHRPQMLDYIALPPPDHVSARITAEGLEVQWQLPPRYLQARIKQFNIYISPKSLIYVPIAKLPAPVASASNDQNSILIRDFPRLPDLFIHVRSQNAKGDLSLPSLPEIHLTLAEVVQ